MFLQRTVFAARRAAVSPVVKRSFTMSIARREAPKFPTDIKLKTLDEIKTEEDLLPPGAPVGTIPTDLDQSTGLERLEILGKMAGVDVFDMKPLDSSRRGTLQDPIMVKAFGDEQYLGCTGSPADSHVTIWLTISRDRPIERCPECGSVYKMEYVGPEDDGHGHEHHEHGHNDYAHPYEGEAKTFADFVKPEYR